MMFRQIAVHGFVARERQTDACSNQAVRFLGRILTDDREGHLSGLDMLQAFASRDQFAVGGENRGDADNVASRNACVAQGELKARKSFAMFTDAFGKENFLSNERHGAGWPCLRE